MTKNRKSEKLVKDVGERVWSQPLVAYRNLLETQTVKGRHGEFMRALVLVS